MAHWHLKEVQVVVWNGLSLDHLLRGPCHHQLDHVSPSGCLGFQIAL